jgi:hypothetical protein
LILSNLVTLFILGIIEYILSPLKVPKINILCILAFDFDVKKLIQFAESCGIPQLKQCFDELLCLTKALLHPDLPQLADVNLRKQLFSRLNIGKLANLLEKVIILINVNNTNSLTKLNPDESNDHICCIK